MENEKTKSMTENKNTAWKKYLQGFLLFVLAGAVTYAGCILHHIEDAGLLRCLVMVFLGTGCVIFSFMLSEEKDLFIYRNHGRFGRFVIAFVLCLLTAVFFPYLPTAGWPFLVVFATLGIFSNMMTGLAAGSVCLLLAVNLSGGDGSVFWLYFISGLTGILVLSTLDEDFKVGLPLVISLMSLLLCLTANIILFANEPLSAAQFLIPGINLFVSCILLLILLKFFCSTVVMRYRERYLEINDPECPLLVRLKEMSRQEYYHAVHTAYLSDRIAHRLQLDDQAAKTCAYYRRIGLLHGENTWENVEKVCREYHFPPSAYRILKEYADPETRIHAAETLIVYFADHVVSAVLYLFEQDPKAEIDYEKLVDTIFEQKMEDAELWENVMTLAQFAQMKKIFVEEKLYYDFLR